MNANAESNNHAILTDSHGTQFPLIISEGIGQQAGGFDRTTDAPLIDRRPYSTVLTFRLPLETEPELDLSLSLWAFQEQGKMLYKIPLENWEVEDRDMLVR